MPLRAFINGQQKVSISYSDSDWALIKDGLKKGDIKVELPCCEQNGFLRTSSKGLKHFIHAKGQSNCYWKPESPEHLAAKAEIVKACIDSGWEAIPEFSENDWRADVLARKNDLRIAFEIQWSAQTSETTEYRQSRYKASNVRGCWFFRKVPKQYRNRYGGNRAVNDIPFFEIKKDSSDKICVDLNNKSIALHEFAKSLLNKEIKFCNSYKAKKHQEVGITFYETSCWKCRKLQHLYTVNNKLKSHCESEIYFTGTMWEEDDLDKHPNVVKAVREITQTMPQYKVGAVKKRYSKTVHESYVSFGCYYCDALFGDFFLSGEKLEALNFGGSQTIVKNIEVGDLENDGPHWCYSTDRNFCI